MSQTGYLHEVGKVLRLCVHKHLLDEARAHLRQTERAYHESEHLCFLVGNIHLRYADRLGSRKKLIDRAVVHRHIHN